MSSVSPRFSLPSRLMHWLMAVLIVAMLFIGVGMAASVSQRYSLLVSIHKPLGMVILVLVAIRFANRLFNNPPPLPANLPLIQRLAAHASHMVLYVLMFVMPLLGWSMLSAEGYPIVLFGSWQLPPILPQQEAVYAVLRRSHTILAYVLFVAVMMHLAAALYHGLIRRDGVLESMASWRGK
jgi:cytochrome b561